MPNRVLRQGILDSERINKLTWPAEVFYRRLMSVVDDYGRFDSRISMIRSSCYPIKLDKVSEADIDKWMSECSEAGLVSLYQVGNKPYLELLDFNQTVRIKRSKYPPNPHAPHLLSTRMLETNPNQTESNLNQNLKTDLIEYFFNDFPNSSQMESVVRALNVKKEVLLVAIPAFRAAANLEYGSMQKFAEHFKNWYLKVYRVKAGGVEGSNKTSIVFGKKHKNG